MAERPAFAAADARPGERRVEVVHDRLVAEVRACGIGHRVLGAVEHDGQLVAAGLTVTVLGARAGS